MFGKYNLELDWETAGESRELTNDDLASEKNKCLNQISSQSITELITV